MFVRLGGPGFGLCFCVNKRSLVLLILSMFKMQFIGPTIGGEEIFLASLLVMGIRSRC